MNFAGFFIRRHVLTWMIMTALIFFGFLGFSRLGISEFPDVDFPVVSVGLDWSGASPQLIESEIIDPAESALSTVEGVKKITSVARTGSANLTAEFELGVDINTAVQDVQAALSRIQRRLPDDVEPASIRKSNPEDAPILWLAVTSESLSRFDLMALVRDKIRPQFTSIPGVSDIFLGGYVEPNFRVWVRPDLLKRLELTAGDLLDTIEREHVELPAGRLESPDREINVRTYGEAMTPEAFAQLPIIRRGGSPNYRSTVMGEVAEFELGLADDRSRARSNGITAIGLGIRKQRNSNAVDVAKAVKDRMREVQSRFDDQIRIAVNFDATKFIEQSIEELLFTLGFAALLTSIVCWFFLGSFAATFNVILAIPTAIIGSFLFLQMYGFTLNTFTLLGLSMAVGIVVDDAIMILENITRHRALGKSRRQAAIDGTNEVFFAVIATTAVLLSIFLPVVFVQGVIGTYLLQFGLTLCIAVALSTVEALTLTPMRCASVLEVKSSGETWVDRIMARWSAFYRRVLVPVLRFRWAIVGVASVLFALSLLLLQGLPREFIPYQDIGRMSVILRGPQGSSIEHMDAKLTEVEAILKSQPEVERWFARVGGDQVNTGSIFVALKDKEFRPKDTQSGKQLGQRDVANKLRERFKDIKGVRVIVSDNSTRGFAAGRGFPVELSVRGPDWDKLAEYSEEIKKRLEGTSELTDVDSNFRAGLPELQVLPRRDRAAAMGVSIGEINRAIQTLIGGVVAGRYSKDGGRFDIRLRLRPDARQSADDIKQVQVRNNRGELVPLGLLVETKEASILQEITREDRERAISLTANVAPGASQEDAIQLAMRISDEVLPEGYRAVMGGSSEAFRETFQALLLAIVLGMAVTYMVLAAQFNSFMQPLVILVALPFSLSGAFIALVLAGQSLNIYSLIGILLVLGLALKNSIMLVDFTNQARRTGLTLQEALLQACPLRLRPILMTSFATIAGAVPAAVSFGPGSEARMPMALAVIGGIFVSTAFTLFVVPCVYRLLVREELSADESEGVDPGGHGSIRYEYKPKKSEASAHVSAKPGGEFKNSPVEPHPEA